MIILHYTKEKQAVYFKRKKIQSMQVKCKMSAIYSDLYNKKIMYQFLRRLHHNPHVLSHFSFK